MSLTQHVDGAAAKPASRVKVAYLVNQYPAVSHTFIRREIMALERMGVAVTRIAMRGWNDVLKDADDLRERDKTRYLLRGGLLPLLGGALLLLLQHPLRCWAALRVAFALSVKSDRSLALHLVYLLEATGLLRWTARAGVQHVHAHFGTNPAEVALLCRALGGPPFSFTVHGPEEFDKPLFLALPRKIEGAAFVVAITSYCRSQLFRWIPFKQWDKVKVVHCGLEPGFHQGAAPAVGTPGRMVCVGRICEQKGQLLLLTALRQVIDRGHQAHLVLAGDGDMRADAEAQIDRLNLRGHVQITGWIDSATVRQELLAARFLVLPSFAEGLPVVVMEAMALRRPALTTSIAGIPELVLDGQNGWLIPPGDVERLADALCAALTASDAEMAVLGAAAHERVLTRHDVDREAEKLARHFEASAAA